MRKTYLYRVFGIVTLVLGTLTLQTIFSTTHAEAATITVNSVADSSSDDGNCTLREAITSANSDAISGIAVGECDAGSGTDTIEFAITPLDSSVKTIAISSQLPKVITQMTIDGFSQDDASENTAIAPAPLNTVLRVEIDGTSIAHEVPSSFASGNCFWISADNVTLQGLNIHSCGNNGILADTADFFTLRGSYIGTNAAGTTAAPNGRNYNSSSIAFGLFLYSVNSASIGGSNPGDRNIIAANQAGDIFISNENNNVNGSGTNVLRGNYIGLAANGTTPLPSGYALGLGNAILIGNSYDDIIGGVNTGDINVIASSSEYGIGFRDGSSGTAIQGNYIGTDYTGAATVTHSLGTGNVQAGIHVGAVSNAGFTRIPNDILIGGSSPAARNIISGNEDGSGYIAGISINDGSFGVIVLNNYIGTDVTGEFSVPNGTGIVLDTSTGIPESYDNIIGGNGEGNVISGNTSYGVLLSGVGTYGNSFQGNKVGTDKDGVSDLGNTLDGFQITNGSYDNIVGGTLSGFENIIAFNGNNGVTVADDGTQASIISNSIFSNDDIGIKLGYGSNPTANDLGDADSGPNDLLNTPYYTSFSESAGNTTVQYRADVPSGNYRVEFFSSSAADPSGSGEGETYIGAQNFTSTGGGWKKSTATLTGVTGVTNLSLTITQISLTSPSGYGATSEFGSEAVPIKDLSIDKVLLNPEDVAIGAEIMYEITVTNQGVDTVDLDNFKNNSPGVDTLFLDIMPTDITYSSTEPGDIACFSASPGSASLYGPILGTHSDHELVFCGYSGTGQILDVGDSISTIISVTVQPSSDLVFENIALQTPSSDDPDIAAFGAAASSGDDIIDVLGDSVNNLAYASYPIPVEPPTSNNSNPSVATTSSTDSPLTETGQNILLISIICVIVLSFSVAKIRRLRKTI